MAIHIAHQNIHFGDHGGSGRQLTELLVLLQFLHREIAAGLQIPHGQLAHRHRPDLSLIHILIAVLFIMDTVKSTKAAIDLREVLTKLTEENAELRRLAKKAEAAQARTAEELQAFREKTSLDRYLLQSYLADELEAHRTAKQVRKQRRRAALENAFRRRVESKLEILANIAQALEKTRAALDDGIDEPGEQELAKHREELDALIAAVRQREAQVRTRSIQRYETALRVLRANPSAKAKAELGEAFDSLRKLLEK